MIRRVRPRHAVVPVLVLGLGGCAFGVGIGGVGFGMGVGSANEVGETAADPEGLRIDSHDVEITVHDDLTADAVIETQRTVVSPAGIAPGQKADVTFEPATQSVELVAAWVIRPDRTRVDLTQADVFTRPSAAAQDTPGFASGRTTSVVFPQLGVGSTTHVKWRFTDRARPSLGFSYVYRPAFSLALEHAHISVTAPAGVKLASGGRGGFDVQETQNADGSVTVTGTLSGYAAGRREPSMISPKDVVPAFAVGNVASWESIGAKFREAAAGSIESTPDIVARAAQVAGNRKGEEAAKEICRWVTSHVNYLSVRMTGSDAWVPHKAGDVLRNGYGDCKDQFVLLASLLASRGIACEAVLIGRDGGLEPLPVPTPRQFDHCIAYLPEFDMYVDPTNSFCEVGDLPIGLRSKFVVHATETGRKAKTPGGRADKNTYVIANAVKLLPNGTIEGMSEIGATGRWAQLLRQLLATRDSESLAADLLVQSCEGGVGSVTSTDPTDLSVPMQVRGRWKTEGAVEMGPAIYLAPPTGIDYANPARALRIIADSDRKYPAMLSPQDVLWVHGIELPSSCDVTRLPRGRSAQTRAGSYTSKWVVETPGRIKIERHLRLEAELIPPASFSEIRTLFDAFLDDAREVIVLRGPATPQ
jgi:transglutaminase-like putative cysteine protease